MYPSQHLFLGVLFAAILVYFFPAIGLIGFLTIALSGFFIDVDHYFLYVYEKGDWNLRRSYWWFREIQKKRCSLSLEQKKKYKYEILVFHGVEFWIPLFALGLLNVFLMDAFIGVMFHMFLDFLALIYFNEPLNYKLSQIYNYARSRDKKHFYN